MAHEGIRALVNETQQSRIPYRRADFWILGIVAAGASVLAVLTLSPLDATFAIPFVGLTLWLVFTDLHYLELPDLGVLAIGVLGFAWIAMTSEMPAEDLLDAASRAIVAVAFFFAIRTAYRWIRGVEGLGLGDVKLAAAGAVWLIWSLMPTALLVAAVAGGLAGGLQAIKTRHLPQTQIMIPLGAFLAPAIWLVWYGERLGIF
jgi:leader peptidase (prepilin peptidase)/N-methyltransferase